MALGSRMAENRHGCCRGKMGVTGEEASHVRSLAFHKQLDLASTFI